MLSNVTAFKTLGNRNEIVQGDNTTLSCTATVGIPSPELEIQNLEGNSIDVLNSTKVNDTANTTLLYHFGQISKEDSGTYSCRVTTDGYASSQNLELSVKCE